MIVLRSGGRRDKEKEGEGQRKEGKCGGSDSGGHRDRPGETNDRARRERNGRERERVGILDLRLPKHRGRLQYISCGKRP